MSTKALCLRALLAVGLLSVACGQAPQSAAVDREEGFLRQAVAAGILQMEMGRLAAQRSRNREIAAFGEMMRVEHTMANAELRKVAARRKMKCSPELDEAQRQDLEAARRMRGPGFDQCFVAHMVTAHREAIAAYQRFAAEVREGDIRLLALRRLPKLQTQLERIEAIQIWQQWEAAGKAKQSPKVIPIPLAIGPETKVL